LNQHDVHVPNFVADMQRRECIILLGGAAAWPITTRAQQSGIPVIGFLSARSEVSGASMAAAFRDGLMEAGYVEDRNLKIEYRWAEGRYDRLKALADELVHRQVEVIVAISGTPAALAAKAATTTIPIVFANGGDPLTSGMVTSLSRPTGNVTGVTFYTVALAGKRMEFLQRLVPKVAAVAILVNPHNPIEENEIKDAEAAARSLGLRLDVQYATSEQEIDAAFASIRQRRADGLVVGSDPLFIGLSHKIVELAARYAIPAIYYAREFPEVGGLMSYGSRQNVTYRQAGVYVGRILQGTKPADLPVMQPTSFEFVLNLKTARSLGLSVSPTLLVQADTVLD
jgi:putative ABC transport system substrate-binding protein